MIYLQVLAGFVLLMGGAEVLVRAAVAIARRLGVSPLVIGMTVVALGTSAPEAVVSVNAAIQGVPTLAIGNVVGSNIANVLLILGVAGLIKPIVTSRDAASKDAWVLVVGTLLFVAWGWSGSIGLIGALVFLTTFVGFLSYSYWREKQGRHGVAEHFVEEVQEMQSGLSNNMPLAAVLFFVGLAGLLWGSDLLVQGGVAVAREWGVPEEVIGLTMVAIGTSLPELAASGVAALRGHPEVAIGNVVGSNLFNLLFVIGLAGLFAPLPVPPAMLRFDIWVMVGATALLLPFLGSGRTLGRPVGLLLLVGYGAYLTALAYGYAAAPVAG